MESVAIKTEEITTEDILSASFGMLNAAWTKAMPVMKTTNGSAEPVFAKKSTIESPIKAMEENTPQNWNLKKF